MENGKLTSDMADTLQTKIMESFIGKVVRKDLAFLVKGNLPVPTYVLEYLLGQYCATDDEEVIAQGLEKVKDVIRNNYINRAESEEVKGKIRENGRFRIIDKVTAVLNDRNDVYQASFANLTLTGVPISDEIIIKNPKLLSGNGVWSIVTLAYQPGDEIKLDFDMKARLIMAKDGVNPEGKNFQAVQWGPLVLARDENIDPEYDRPVKIVSAADGTVEVRRIAAERPGTKVEFEVPTTTGTIRMVDYASVDCWEGSHVQTWLPVLK